MLETVVALGVIMGGLIVLLPMYTASLVQTGFAKQREVATTLLDKTMEQVRALPFATVQKGLDNTDVVGSADSRITISGNTYTFTNGETIPHGTLGYTQAPLVPHLSSPVINGTTYTVGVYPTNYAGSAGVYRITVIVSWAHTIKSGVSSSLTGQTLVSSAPGCLSSATHPFGAPCQPFLYATATTADGYIRITSIPDDTSLPIRGVPVDKAEIDLTQSYSSMQIEQVAKVLGQSKTSGGAFHLNDDSTVSTGDVIAAVQADNDPGSTANPSQSASALQSGSSISQNDGTANPNSITIAPGSLDTGGAVSTSSASVNPACNDLLAIPLTTALPCGSGKVQQLGTALSLSSGLYSGSSSLGSILIASVAAAPSETRLFTSRHTLTGGTYCASTSGDGCVHAAAQRSFGTIQLAALPTQFLTDGAKPAGWGTGSNNYLIQLTNYSDKVVSESGVSAGSPTASQLPANGMGTPTLSYWNGAGYTSLAVNWGTVAPAISIPTVTITDAAVPGGSVTVTITPSIQLGATATAVNSPAGCNPACTSSATVASPISGHITYTVTRGTDTLASFDITVDLGTLSAQTSYRAAPSAS
jgi:hypothetical protein